MNQSTKITTASVRVMRSIDFGNYETSLTVENPNGVTEADITDCIDKCHVLTNQSIEIYLKGKVVESKAIQAGEKRRIGSVLNDIKQLVPEATEPSIDPLEIAQVEALPMYTPNPKMVAPAKRINGKKVQA